MCSFLSLSILSFQAFFLKKVEKKQTNNNERRSENGIERQELKNRFSMKRTTFLVDEYF